MRQLLQFIGVVLAILLSLKFFDATFLPEKLLLYGSYLVVAAGFVVALPRLIRERGGFALPVRLVLLSILVSAAMAYLAWGQGIKDSVFQALPFMTWIFFFVFLRLKLRIATAERIVMFFGLVYISLYFFQLSQAPTVLFGKSLWGDEFTIDRGVVRIIFPGAGVFILTSLMALNKLTSGAKGRVLWAVLAGLGLLIPILQVTRQFIAGMFLLYLLHLTRTQHWLQRVVTAAGTLTLLMVVLNAGIPQIDGILEAGERDVSLGSDYIRVAAGQYFLFDFSPDFPSRVLGNGVADWGLSGYGRFVEQLGLNRGYFLSDVGIIGVYAQFGIFAVLAFVLIWTKSFTIPLPPQFQYLKYYLWYLLFTSLTWFTVYHHHYVIATVSALYLYQVVWSRTHRITRPNGETEKIYLPES
ncbi:MAG: hypothetical protein WBA17_02505 [Saprospiraceae bacterium]